MKKGFSLAELMVVLVVAGTIAALTIPVLTNSTNNNNKVLYKSAFRLVESIVNEETSDLVLFPNGTLDNSSTAVNPQVYQVCNDFMNKVNTLTVAGTVGCGNGVVSSMPGSPNFVSTNGMRWYGFEQQFAGNPAMITITVDVNGTNGPNINDTTNTTRDILRINIYQSGKVSAPAGTETTDLSS